MHPYARILNEMGHSSMKTWQRDYSTAAIRKWLPDLTYPPYHKHDVNFISQAEISRMYQSIEKKEINNSSWNVPTAKENSHQMSPASLLNYNRKLTKGSKFSSSSLGFINYKSKNNKASNSKNKRSTSDTLIITEENWIQQISFKIKSIFTDVHTKIRSYSTNMLDLYPLKNEKILISNNIILSSSKDCGSKSSIRQKIQAFCEQHKKSLKKMGKDDVCKKKDNCCATEKKKNENMCGKKEKHVISCKREENSCSSTKNSCKSKRNDTCNKKDPCKQNKNNNCGTKKEQFCTKRQEDPCKGEEEIRNNSCSRNKKDPCELEELSQTLQDIFKHEYRYIKKDENLNDMQENNTCKEEKPDCSETRKINPCHQKKNDCSPVKKLATNFHRCDDQHIEESNLSYYDRPSNDDYFPQGEEYEDEIGTDDQQLKTEKKTPNKKSSHSNDKYNNFDSTMLKFENNENINRGPLTRFVTLHFLNTKLTRNENNAED
ncbi:hypothetical protein ACFW04_013816 [Cataglyphis niger]